MSSRVDDILARHMEVAAKRELARPGQARYDHIWNSVLFERIRLYVRTDEVRDTCTIGAKAMLGWGGCGTTSTFLSPWKMPKEDRDNLMRFMVEDSKGLCRAILKRMTRICVKRMGHGLDPEGTR